MFAAPQIFQDSKENIKSTSLPSKTNNSRKGLKPCSLNNFTEPTQRLKSEKSVSKDDQSYSKLSLGEKENSKPKIKVQETKVSSEENDFWPDEIEEMHICIEPDDYYEDIVPLCERIHREDVNNLFLDFSSDMYADLPSDDEPPSPIKVSIDFNIPDISPTILEFNCPSFDVHDLEFIPLPDFVL